MSGWAQDLPSARTRWKSALVRSRCARCRPRGRLESGQASAPRAADRAPAGSGPRGWLRTAEVLDDGEALAATEPPTPEHVAATRAAHPLQKAVLALTRNPLGLIGPLHLDSISCFARCDDRARRVAAGRSRERQADAGRFRGGRRRGTTRVVWQSLPRAVRRDILVLRSIAGRRPALLALPPFTPRSSPGDAPTARAGVTFTLRPPRACTTSIMLKSGV
jgi:hypothetical protein